MFKIEQLLKHRIYIDTCSLMHPIAWSYTSETLIQVLKANGATIIVPLHVLDELRKLQNKEGNTGLQASLGLRAVAAMLEAGVLELSGADEGTFVDNYFLYIFTKLRLSYNLALITQDKKLAMDIYSLSNHQSVRWQKDILLLKFDQCGLVEWAFNSANHGLQHESLSMMLPQPAAKTEHLARKPGIPIPIKKAIFSKEQLIKTFPQWTRRDLVRLCIDIAVKIDSFHRAGVPGGIDQSDIVVYSNGTAGIINVSKSQEVEFEQEYYDLAVLLFMILLPGKHPFSPGTSSGPGDKVRLLEFPYPLGERGSRYTPGAPWKYIWSHLPYRIKQMFYSVFAEGACIQPEEWVEALQDYLRLLEVGHVSDEIFPAGRKILNPCEVTCARCGVRETQERKWIESLEAEGKSYLCEACLEMERKARRRRDGNNDRHVNYPGLKAGACGNPASSCL